MKREMGYDEGFVVQGKQCSAANVPSTLARRNANEDRDFSRALWPWRKPGLTKVEKINVSLKGRHSQTGCEEKKEEEEEEIGRK